MVPLVASTLVMVTKKSSPTATPTTARVRTTAHANILMATLLLLRNTRQAACRPRAEGFVGFNAHPMPTVRGCCFSITVDGFVVGYIRGNSQRDRGVDACYLQGDGATSVVSSQK